MYDTGGRGSQKNLFISAHFLLNYLTFLGNVISILAFLEREIQTNEDLHIQYLADLSEVILGDFSKAIG